MGSGSAREYPPEAKAFGRNAALSVAVADDRRNWALKIAPRLTGDRNRFDWPNALSIHLDPVEGAALAAVMRGLMPTLPDPDTGKPDGGIYHESPSGAKRKLTARILGSFVAVRLREWRHDTAPRDLEVRACPRARFLIGTMIALTLPTVAATTRIAGLGGLIARADGDRLIHWCARTLYTPNEPHTS